MCVDTSDGTCATPFDSDHDMCSAKLSIYNVSHFVCVDICDMSTNVDVFRCGSDFVQQTDSGMFTVIFIVNYILC